VKISAVSQLALSEQTAIKEYLDRIQQRFPDRVVAVMLFGSKARGDADAESDIDLLILVDLEANELRSELWRIAADVSLEYNLVLSPRVFDQNRWAEIRRLRLPLYRAIVSESIPLIPGHNIFAKAALNS
jgi:predicted nucleotidyltransferase